MAARPASRPSRTDEDGAPPGCDLASLGSGGPEETTLRIRPFRGNRSRWLVAPLLFAWLLALPAAALLGPPELAAPEHVAEQASAEAAPAAEDPLDDFDFEDEAWLDEPPDHLECGNRAVFVLNDQLYRFVFDPLSDVWEFVIPKPVRSSLQRFFANLREPANFVNKLAQRRGLQARDTGARFLLNSTVGIGGLFDPAKRLGF